MNILAVVFSSCMACIAQNIQKANIAQVYVREYDTCSDSVRSCSFLIFLNSDSIANLDVSCDEASAFWIYRDQKTKNVFRDFIKHYNDGNKKEYLDPGALLCNIIDQDSLVSRLKDSTITASYTEKFWAKNDSLFSLFSVGGEEYLSGYTKLSKW